VLRTDDEALSAASADFGLFVNRRPVAVLEPASVQDVARVIRFANNHDLRIAVRGNGHSVYGQTLVKGGIVIQMSTLSKARNLPGARVLAGAGCSWGAVLEETLKEERRRPSFRTISGSALAELCRSAASARPPIAMARRSTTLKRCRS
jgi:cytokinin dehydrogenase